MGTDERSPRQLLVFAEQEAGYAVVVSVAGDLDMAMAPQLEEHLEEVLRRRPAALVIDLSGIEFLGSAGVNVLYKIHQSSGDVACAVVADGPVTRRPLQILGFDRVGGVYPTLADAVEAIASS